MPRTANVMSVQRQQHIWPAVCAYIFRRTDLVCISRQFVSECLLQKLTQYYTNRNDKQCCLAQGALSQVGAKLFLPLQTFHAVVSAVRYVSLPQHTMLLLHPLQYAGLEVLQSLVWQHQVEQEFFCRGNTHVRLYCQGPAVGAGAQCLQFPCLCCRCPMFSSAGPVRHASQFNAQAAWTASQHYRQAEGLWPDA